MRERQLDSNTSCCHGRYKIGRCFSHLKWEQMVAGVTGGVVTTAVLHPLDLAKTRLQVNEGNEAVKVRPRSSRFSGTLLEIYRARGFVGFYQGVTPNLLGNAVSWGLYFFLYGALKNYAQGGDPSKKLSMACYFGYSTISGLVVSWMTNPIWVAKTRMCLQYETLDASGRLTTWGTLRFIWLTEGLRGLYRGIVPGMVGVSNGALQFLFYEELRNSYNSFQRRPIDVHLKASEYLLMGVLSKTLAVAVTYPYQVVRTRLQEQHRNYGTMTNLLKTIFRYEGVFGFYKGLFPNILRTAPACGLTFVVYENCYKYLKAS